MATVDASGLYGLDAEALIRFAKAWASLGDAITEQIEDVVIEGAVAADFNLNAIVAARRELKGMNEEIDEALADAIAFSQEKEREGGEEE